VLELAGLDRSLSGDCGYWLRTGASTILLAKELDAEITAVNFLTVFLDELQSRAHDHGVVDKIITLNCSMDALPFAVGEFDVIWSEGAIITWASRPGSRL
jgi:hypothetical protein